MITPKTPEQTAAELLLVDQITGKPAGTALGYIVAGITAGGEFAVSVTSCCMGHCGVDLEVIGSALQQSYPPCSDGSE